MDARTRKIIEEQKDPRILQALLSQALEHIEMQKGMIDKLQAAKALEAQSMFGLEERVKLLVRQLYGKKSEKRNEATDRPRDKSLEEALLFSQATFPTPEKRDDQRPQLEEAVVDHRLTEADLANESSLRGFSNSTTSDWKSLELFDESSKIQIIERSYVREKHRRYKYKYVGDESPEKEIIVTAPGPCELLPGMSYTAEFVASIVSDKYISHMPIERQTREMESLGLKGMKNSTLSRHCALAAAALEKLQEKILADLLKTDLALHIDETPWKIQNKNEKDGYMWVISNRTAAYYFFKPTRSGQVLREKLGQYKGPAVTDGFSGYGILEEIEIPHAYCWAHARREFLPLENHDPTVKPILDLIDKLFEIERRAKTFAELKILRSVESRPILLLLKSILETELLRSRKSSQKKKAIEYTLKRWAGLTLFESDTRVPLSNNEAERTIRHAVMGRKNFYGSGNSSGADTAATLYTIIESCKKNDIDPRSFILFCLQKVAAGEELETPLEYARRLRQHAN
jgi:transposase